MFTGITCVLKKGDLLKCEYSYFVSDLISLAEVSALWVLVVINIINNNDIICVINITIIIIKTNNITSILARLVIHLYLLLPRQLTLL